MIEFLYRHPEGYIEASSLLFDVLLIIFTALQTRNGQVKIFRRLLYLSTVLTLCEVISTSWMKDLPATKFSFYAINLANTMVYLCTCLIGYWLANYFAETFRVRWPFFIEYLRNTLLFFYMLVLLLNIQTGCISLYRYDTGEYVHGRMFFPVGNGIPLFFFACALIVFFKTFPQMKGKMRLSMCCVMGLTVAGAIVQPLFNDKVSITGLFASLAIALLYFSIETRDYNELHVATEKLKKARENALTANEAKSTFLENMSHEVRTPLNAILGLNELVIKESRDEKTREYAKDMLTAGQTLLSVISDVLDVSLVESGKLEIEDRKYHFSNALRACKVIIGARAEKKNLDFRVNVDETLPDVLSGDEGRIRQVMINLLNNAVKYTEHGRVELEVQGDTQGGMLHLTIAVSDTGIGIKEEDRQKLFQSYERFDRAKNRKVEGTGLGLSIVHQIIEKMGGTIDVKSAYGVGSTFTVRIAQRVLDSVTIEEYRQQKTGYQKPPYIIRIPSAKLLIVDDNEMNLKVAKGLLRNSGAEIFLANGGEEALRILETEKFDLVFMDSFMPVVDGTEVLHIVREDRNHLNYHTPMAVVTADALSDSREKYMKVGFDGYISKPMRAEKLYKMIEKLMSEDKLIKEELL